MEHAATAQRELIARLMCDAGRPSKTVVAASTLLRAPAVWEARPDAACGAPLFEGVFPLRARALRRRVVVDSLVTTEEAAHFTTDGALNRLGEPIFGGEETEEDADERARGVAEASGWHDWAEHPLNGRVRDAVRGAVRLHFDERRPLHLAAAVLTRRAAGCGAGRLHVDQANVGYYDYSAVLYLSSAGADFGGGGFTFVGPAADEVVQPRLGRCVLFSSGTEHPHRVEAVASGARHAIGLWFTLTRECGECEAPCR